MNTNHGGFKNSNSNNKSVLVVDDEPDIVDLINESLQKSGQKVSVFTDPTMALEDFKVNCKTCSLILSDIRMPGINGYEFVKKAKEIDRQVKVILMSAFEINEREFHNMLPDIKVDAFLQKPFSIQQLNNIVEKLM
ncbi:MAG TPA: response regulator [Nitrososphaeraceae archaeon]|nr:response regulator [Nitrososphaeraceae archaeon]